MSSVTLDTAGFRRFLSRLEPEVTAAVTATVQAGMAEAKRINADRSHALEQSIEARGSGLQQSYGSDLEYAAAQEYGRPDLPNYDFTPYMRPSAEGQRHRHTERVAAAIRRAKG